MNCKKKGFGSWVWVWYGMGMGMVHTKNQNILFLNNSYFIIDLEHKKLLAGGITLYYV